MNKKFSAIFFLAAGIIVFLIIYVVRMKEERQLRDRFKVDAARLDSIGPIIRGSGMFVYYRYQIADKKYRERQEVFVSSAHRNLLTSLLLNHRMPIVYDSLDPSNSQVLLSSKDFASYRIQPADSLLSVVHVIDSLRY